MKRLLVVRAVLALAFTLAVGCGDTGLHRISVPLFGAGTQTEPFEVGDWTVRLDDARVGMGPIYFCAAESSDAALCPSSVAELTDSITVDALDGTRERLGTLDAISVEARSVAWDFAITWPSSEGSKVVLDGAPEGHSAHFEGVASHADRELHFVADIDLAPRLRGTHAVQGVLTEASLEAGIECELRIDAAAWWSAVDFDELAMSDADPIVIAPRSRAYDALTVAMTSSSPPTIHWSVER